MPFEEYTIKYNSASLPSIKGETDIELLLEFHDDKWVLNRNLGTMYEQDSAMILLDASVVEDLFRCLSDINVPILLKGEWGCDGTMYTLQISHEFTSVTYEWWEDLPFGLKPLEAMIANLFKYAEVDLGILEDNDQKE